MSFSLDPEIAAGLALLYAAAGPPPPPPVGDIESRRSGVEDRLRALFSQRPDPDDVTTKDYEVTTSDGASLLLRWYEKSGASPGSAVLYAHGGGMILANVEIYDGVISRYVSETGVPFLSVEYRYAPEFPAPTPVTDCYAALQWLAAQAPTLGVDPNRIAIMGDSGGGGVMASLAIYARDQGGPAIARQILIYPMLDDRNTVPDGEIAPFASWSYDDNITGWGALLGASAGGSDVSPYAAAARLKDFTNLPRAYIEVGELDIFRDEDIAFAQGLLGAGVSTELHVHPAAPHVFEHLVPTADVAQRSAEDRRRVLRSL